MKTQSTFAFKPKQSLETNQGNLSAMVYVLGRNAFTAGKSIFDCPYEIGSDKESLWMDGFQFESKDGEDVGVDAETQKDIKFLAEQLFSDIQYKHYLKTGKIY